ncbi:MAG TPA: hypothetical protein VGS13_06785 [Stellaceae bacterium]|nr:hypothetical protein [Stellaceae bacterium]
MSDGDVKAAGGGHRPVSQAPGERTIAGADTSLFVAVGIGGRLELTAEEIRLVKGGVFGHAVELLWLGYGVSQTTIPVRAISAVEIVKPMIMPDFIRFSYAGSPPRTHNYIDDALAENALLMGWFDNRAFYRIKAWIEGWPHKPPAPVDPAPPGAA